MVPVGRTVAGSLVSSEWSTVGLVSWGFGVKVTVEVTATGGALANDGGAFDVALPHGGQGLDAVMALLDRNSAKRCESPESESSESSLSKVG